jgi:hypothetical protein
VRTYRISSWDHEADDWHVEASGVRLMALRQYIRDLLARGYDWDFSIAVQREAAS